MMMGMGMGMVMMTVVVMMSFMLIPFRNSRSLVKGFPNKTLEIPIDVCKGDGDGDGDRDGTVQTFVSE